MSKLAKTDQAVIDSARDLFMQHVPMNDIASRLKISTAALAKWRTDGGWVEARKNADELVLEDTVAKRKLDLMRISDDAIHQIKRSVKAVVDDPEPPTLHQAKLLAEIVTMTDKITRLDRQQATENVAVQHTVKGTISVDRIKEIVMSDAFLAPETPAAPKE